MGRPSIGVLAVAVGFALAAPAWPASPAEEPAVSVLLVTLDTTRADHLGSYGADFASTPNLDALARDGVRFEQALSPTPLTLPSHTSLLTGMVPRRHGVRNNALLRLGPDPELLPEILGRRGYRTGAFVSSVVLDRITGLARGFEHYDDGVRIGAREAFNYEERAASQTNDAVLRHLEGLTGPFFLWVHYFDPHLPYVPPQPHRDRFADRPYDGEIAFMDEQIGRLLAAVRRKTSALLIVVAGDHGESLGEHGEASHGVFVYEATQRVPLILAGPGVPRGRVIRERVGLIDVAPTVLDLLGLPPLGDADGHSLAPWLRGERAAAHDYELESLFGTYSYGWAPLRALVRRGYKYIEAPRTELYRLDTDPAEVNNLADEENRRASALGRRLRVLVPGDVAESTHVEPELAEHRRRLESLGYVAGGTAAQESEAIDPKDGIAWISDLEAGRRAYQTGNPEDGIAPLRRLLARNPDNVPALLALALCHLGTGRPADAVRIDRRALEIRPDDDLVHFNLANALAASREQRPDALPQARRHYERALALNPRFADAYLNYASLLERSDSPAEALELLERARAEGVRDPDLETRLAVLALKKGDVGAAMDAFRRALELHPRAAGPLEAMARISYRQGRYAESAVFYEKLLDVAPSAANARTLGSIRLDRLGDPAGARIAYLRALALTAPGDPERESLRALIDELAGHP